MMKFRIETSELGIELNPDYSVGQSGNSSQPPLDRGGTGSAIPLSRGSWRGFGFNNHFRFNRQFAPSRRNCPSSSRGFTLIELIVVIIIVMVMMAIFLNRVRYYQEQAEKTAMEEVAGALQSALILQYGQLLTRGQASDLPVLLSDNPMNWLQKKPRNYAGEFFAPRPNSIVAGNWMFDLKSRELIYVPRNHDNLHPAQDGKVWIRFHITPYYEPSRLPSLQNEPATLTGTLFEPVQPYVWF